MDPMILMRPERWRWPEARKTRDEAEASAASERAIIDIGSNTVRLVIYGGPPRAPVVLHNEKVTAKLGKGVGESGVLGAKPMNQARAALARFGALLALRGVTDIQTVATAAVRDAANGAAFLESVAALGLAPRLLSGEEEALASAHGVRAAFPHGQGVVGDLGGGSLELVDIDPHGASHGTSLPLGTLRLPALREGGEARFARTVRERLAQAAWRGGQGDDFYLVGGAWRAFGRYAIWRRDWPIDDVHGLTLAADEVLELARLITTAKPARSTPPTETPPIPPARLAALPDAAALLAELVRALAPARIVVSSWGLREGLLAQTLDPTLAGDDPLLAGVTAFVGGMAVRGGMRGAGATPGEDLAALAASVVGWSARIVPATTGETRRLRLAATMLALAAMRTEPNLRDAIAVTWALRKRWIGVTAEGRAMLAMAALANTGRTAIPPALARLASPEKLQEAVCWGLATRLCRRLSGPIPAVLAGSALAVVEGRLVLAIHAPLAALASELAERDLKLLAHALGLPGELRIVDSAAMLP